MAQVPHFTPAAQPARVHRRSSFSAPFGVPLGDLGLLTTLIMSTAVAVGAFFLATFVAILVLLATGSSGHPVDYAMSYRRIGLPIGIVAGVLAFAYLGTLWMRRILRRA